MLVMTPDVTFEESRAKKEFAKLNNMVRNLSTEERKQIFKDG